MTRDERTKAINNAVAVALNNPLVPNAVRVGIAALAEEARDLHDRVSRIEQAAARFGEPIGAARSATESAEQ